MLAFLGFASTAAVNGKGPIASLQAHLADPNHNNSEWTRDALKVFAVFPAGIPRPVSEPHVTWTRE
jgi:hypothetical protein